MHDVYLKEGNTGPTVTRFTESFPFKRQFHTHRRTIVALKLKVKY